MAARAMAWAIGAMLAASLVFWALRLGVRGEALPPQTRTVALDQAARGDVQRLLGGVAAAPVDAVLPVPAAASRFRLVGVLAGADARSAAAGVALLSVDGQAPRAYRVGATVEGDWVLQRVAVRQIDIGPRGAAPALVLDLPALPPPATGQLAAAATPGLPGSPGRPASLVAPQPALPVAPPLPVSAIVQPPDEPIPSPGEGRSGRSPAGVQP